MKLNKFTVTEEISPPLSSLKQRMIVILLKYNKKDVRHCKSIDTAIN